MTVKCEKCRNETDSAFTSLVFEGVFCDKCAISLLPCVNKGDKQDRIFTDELKSLVKFHVEHNEMESENFQMAAYLGELISVINSDKFKKLKREINAIVKKEIGKRITQGIEDKLHVPNVNYILDCRIDSFDLTTRTFNALKSENIHLIRDLVKYTSADLLSLNALGRKSLNEILDMLRSMGLRFPTSRLRRSEPSEDK